MAVPPRFLLAVALGGPLLLLAGCGSDATGARTTLVEIQPESYHVDPPITTTTTTSLPPAPLDGQTSTVEQLYVVVPNDSVYGIADKHGVEPEALANYNSWPEGISHPLAVGDQVKIPPGAQVPSLTPTTDPATATGDSVPSGETPATGTNANGDDCPTTYTIADGDTSRIKVAAKFGITYEQMDAANANTPGYTSFIVGTEITIPCPN